MAFWVTQAELEAKVLSSRLQNWGDKNRDGTVDSATLTLACQEAQSRLYAYLGGRYGESMRAWTNATTPWLVKSLYLDLALWFFATGSNTISPTVQKRYEEALTTLEQLRKGDLELFDEINDTMLTENSTTFAPVSIVPDTENRVFTREGLGALPAQARPTIFNRGLEDYDSNPETSG